MVLLSPVLLLYDEGLSVQSLQMMAVLGLLRWLIDWLSEDDEFSDNRDSEERLWLLELIDVFLSDLCRLNRCFSCLESMFGRLFNA